MFRRVGSTVAVCVSLVASGVLLGQAMSPGDEAAAQGGEEGGELVGKTNPALVVRELRILRRRLADVRNRHSALFYLREIDDHTSEICLQLAPSERPPKCF